MAYEKQLNRMDRSLEEVVSQMRQAEENVVYYQPNGRDWSAVQHLEHVRMAEAISLDSLKSKRAEYGNFEKAGLKNSLRSLALKVALRSGKKFKAPVSKLENVDNEKSLDQLFGEYRDGRKALREFITTFPEEHRSKAIFKHPVIGRISVKQMLAFFEDHFDHHKKIIQTRLNRD